LGEALFALAHLRAFHLIIVGHTACVFLSLVDDAHIIGHALDVVLVILRLQEELLAILKAFNIAKEVCSLVSTRVGPFYITLSWVFYSKFGFSYFGRIDGIHIIH
jgi:hypothetical protein